jgi:hypothetical protein
MAESKKGKKCWFKFPYKPHRKKEEGKYGGYILYSCMKIEQ